jgi:hypothetical protein
MVRAIPSLKNLRFSFATNSLPFFNELFDVLRQYLAQPIVNRVVHGDTGFADPVTDSAGGRN